MQGANTLSSLFQKVEAFSLPNCYWMMTRLDLLVLCFGPYLCCCLVVGNHVLERSLKSFLKNTDLWTFRSKGMILVWPWMPFYAERIELIIVSRGKSSHKLTLIIVKLMMLLLSDHYFSHCFNGLT